MLKNLIQNMIKNIVKIKRFTLPTLCVFLFFFLSIDIVDVDQSVFYMKVLFCGCLWFAALKLLFESLHWKLRYYYSIGTIIFLLIALQIYHSSIIASILLAVGLFFAVFIAAFLFKKEANIQIWSFNYKLWIGLCFAALTSVIFFLACALIILSVDFLFELKTNKQYYFYLWILAATLFAPLITIANIPKNYDLTEINYPSSLRNVLSYIIVPSLFIYAALFYIYCIKIILNMALPKGAIVYIVSAFSSVGIITYIISYPLHNSPGIINLFSRYFFKTLLIPLILLAIAIGIRINQYGMTEARYVVILGLIWFSLSSLFALFMNKNEILKFILSSIVFLLLSASFGPWGIDNVMAKSKIKSEAAYTVK